MSEVLQMSAPLPFTVKVPLVKLALPASPGVPISVSLQPDGRPVLGLTIRLTVVECDRLPFTPVMVSVKVPVEAVPEVETLSVEAPEPLMEVGLNVPAAPLDNPVTLKPTVPVNPFIGVTETV